MSLPATASAQSEVLSNLCKSDHDRSDVHSGSKLFPLTFGGLSLTAMMYMRQNLGSADLFLEDSVLHSYTTQIQRAALDRRYSSHSGSSNEPRSSEAEVREMYNGALIELFALTDEPKFLGYLSELAAGRGVDHEAVISQRAKAREYLGWPQVSEDPFKLYRAPDEGSRSDPSTDDAAYDTDETVTAGSQVDPQTGDTAKAGVVSADRSDQSVSNEQPEEP